LEGNKTLKSLSRSILITLTRLNGKEFIINALNIETIESFPDTAILLTNGRRYVVRESAEVVYQRTISFYQGVNLLGRLPAGGVDNEE
jgi:flagellar protein FlbD